MLVIAASISASLGFGFFLSSAAAAMICPDWQRSEEHTSELQSQSNIVCRLLLEKKNKVRAILESITPNICWCGASGNGHSAKLINHAVADVNRLLTYDDLALGFKYGLSCGDMSK